MRYAKYGVTVMESESLGRDIKDAVMRWLLDEGFEVRKLDVLQGTRLVWGLDTFTPPPLRVNIKVFQPERFKDRVVVLLGVKVSPEHQAEIAKLDRKDRVRFTSKLLLRMLSICKTCGIAFQPSLSDFKAIAVARTLYIERLDRPLFMETVMTLINTFLAIIATFNESFPQVTKEATRQEGEEPLTHM